MRAVGLSKLQMGVATLLPLGVLTLLMVVNINTAGQAGQQRAEELANPTNARRIMAGYADLLARQGDLDHGQTPREDRSGNIPRFGRGNSL